MSITEFASLELRHPHALSAPPHALIALLHRLADQQSARSGYPLFFFTEPARPGWLHLLTGWKSVSAHEDWIASAQNQELLSDSGQFLEVKDLVHLNMDISGFPADKVEEMVCKKYKPGMMGGIEAFESEMEEQPGDVKWSGMGKDMDPTSEGASVVFLACSGAWRLPMRELGSKGTEAMLLKRFELEVTA